MGSGFTRGRFGYSLLSNVSANGLSRFPVDQLDACVGNFPVATVMVQDDVDQGEESQVLVVEKVGQDSCLNEESEQFTIAAVQPILQDKTRSGE